MSGEIVTNVWKYSKQKGGELLVLLALADAANGDGFCWAGSLWLQKMTRLSRRQILRNVNHLQSGNELWIHARPGKYHLYIVLPGLAEEQFFTACVRHLKYTAEEARSGWATIITRDKMSPATRDKMSPPRDKMSPATRDKMSPGGDKMSHDPFIRYKDIWDDTLEILRGSLPNATYEQHFARSQLLDLNGTTATILLPVKGSVEWVSARLADKVKFALKYSANTEYDQLVLHEKVPA